MYWAQRSDSSYITYYITRINWSPHLFIYYSRVLTTQDVNVCIQAEATQIVPTATDLHGGERND